MDIELTVRAGHVSDRNKDYAREKIGKVGKRFDRVGGVHITLDTHKEEENHVHVHVHLDSGKVLVAESKGGELRSTIDDVSDNLVRQVRRQKERLIDRNRKAGQTPPGLDDLEPPSSDPSYEDVIRDDLES